MAFRVHSPTASYVKRDRVCAHPHVNWLLPAWVLYLSGAIGYIVVDMVTILEARISDAAINSAFLALALVYFVDSLCYFLAWLIPELERRDHEPGYDRRVRRGAVVIDSAAWGEILYIFSAVFGVISAGCLFLVPLSEGGHIRVILSSVFALFAYGATLWISNTLYLVDACVYWSAWYNKRVTTIGERDNVMFDGYFWADGILLTVPSLIYFVTSTVLVFNLYTISVAYDAQETFDIAKMLVQAQNMIRIGRAFNVVADFIYVADAFVYMIAWLADAETIKKLRIERGQDLPEIDLGQSFEVESGTVLVTPFS